jgi:predicted GIY-YIG superfamily endonuclease
VTLVYHEEHPTLSAVRKREAAVKRMPRAQKEALIRQSHPST